MKKVLLIFMAALSVSLTCHAETYDIRDFGAKGDGATIDSPAINAAIRKASENGGGTVIIPTGKYASYSIRLASHVEIRFEAGATLIAAKPSASEGFDAAEPGPQPQFQDFGHSHWQNSLFWGIGLEDVTISGRGFIDGSNLSEGYGDRAVATGTANKTIALKECRNVVLKDFTVYRGGHFVLLATGVENLTIDELSLDTARDGLDIDCCRNVRVSNCLVNSPYDDAIVLKSSYALGRFFDTENVVISNCNISGYACGSVLNCTYAEVKGLNPHSSGILVYRAAGRIKLGTESSGGFKNIAVTNCTLSYCGGILLESVDGGNLEDVVVSNCTIRDCSDSPIFVRLGSRMRSPRGTPVGSIRRVHISNINSYNANSIFGVQISGIPGHCIEDLTLSNIHLNFEGGKDVSDAITVIPENEKAYPDPWMFALVRANDDQSLKPLPMKGMLLRHVDGIHLDGVHFSYGKPDSRPLLIMDDVRNIFCEEISLQGEPVKVPYFNKYNKRYVK